jgi:HK97 family phage portal protein
MSNLLTRLSKRVAAWYLKEEIRSYFVDNISPQDPYMAMLFGTGVKTKAGQFVTEEKALTLAPFFSAISLIATSVASMPLCIRKKVIYEEDNNDETNEYYCSHLLEYKPNNMFNAYTFKEWTIWRAILKGNAYWLIDRDEEQFDKIDALWALEPDMVKPYLDSEGNKKFEYTYYVNQVKKTVIYDDTEIVHIPGFKYDGIKGYGILDFARESVGSGLAVDQFGAQFFSGDGMATGVITHPQRLRKEAKINIKESFKEQATGVETATNSGGRGVVVLDEGMTFNKTGISPEEGQFLGTREFTVEEVCRWLHIPLFLMSVGTTASALSAEDQYKMYLNFGLKPWLDRITSEITVKLLNKSDREEWMPWFDVDALNMMALKELVEVLSQERNLGLWTLNNLSKKLGIPLTKNRVGDQRIAPSTMKILGGTDPTTPVPMDTISGFLDQVRSDRNMTQEAAMAMAALLMPTASVNQVKKMIEPLLPGAGRYPPAPPPPPAPLPRSGQ